MKILFAMLVLHFGFQIFAAETNDLTHSDIASRTYESDYGKVVILMQDFFGVPKWDTDKSLPISVEQALAAAKKVLPPQEKEPWSLDTIVLENFGYQGVWYYILKFTTDSTFTRENRHYIVTRDYLSIVLMDGRVLIPQPSMKP